MKNLSLTVLFILFWVVFAFRFEKANHKDAYSAGKAREEDSISSSLRKIRYCATYDLRTIKWRRSLISAVIVTFLLFLLVWMRLPSPSELLTHIILTIAVFSTVWRNFSTRTSRDAAVHVDSNVAHIKHLLTKNHSFILPDWS